MTKSYIPQISVSYDEYEGGGGYVKMYWNTLVILLDHILLFDMYDINTFNYSLF